MESLTGDWNVTLDDKGRISLPARLRSALDNSGLMLTKGEDNCLALYPSHEWNALLKTVLDATNQFEAKHRNIRRRIIGPSMPVELDKMGRIPVSQSLREYAGLNKDCVVLGQFEYIEIWDEARYKTYLEATEEEFKSGTEELGALLRKDRD
jgi:MraZ protein